MLPPPPRPRRLSRRGLLAALAPLAAARCAGPLSGPLEACRFDAGDPVPVAVVNGLPFVAVAVNGTRVAALLDTGAEGTLVAEPLVAALRVPADPQRLSVQSGVTGFTAPRPLAVLGRLEVGGQAFRNLRAGVVAPLAMPAPDGHQAQVILGADLLRRHDLDLDLPGRRLTLHPAQPCRLEALPFPGPAYALPMRVTSRGHVLVEVEANGRPAEAILDTGANVVQLTRARARSLGVTEEALAGGPRRQVRGVNNQAREVVVVRLDRLRIGPEEHRGVLATVAEDGPGEFILGTPWLLGRRIWLSYGQEALRVALPPGGAGGAAKPPPL